MTQNQATLEDRYGNAKLNRRNKILGITFATMMLLMGAAFLIFGGMPSADKEIEFRDVAFNIESDHSATLTFEVTTAAKKDLVCAVDALSPSYATVGIKYIEIEASNDRTRVFKSTVQTSHRATAITVNRCWFRED